MAFCQFRVANLIRYNLQRFTVYPEVNEIVTSTYIWPDPEYQLIPRHHRFRISMPIRSISSNYG